MKFLVSAALADGELQSIEPWLDMPAPVWEGAAPLGVFLVAADLARFQGSAFADLMAVMNVPVSQGPNLADFCAAAMAARIDILTDEAAGERAAAAALRKDYMQLQEKFSAVEGFLNGAMAPHFILARQWDFSGETVSLTAGEVLTQALPVSGAGLGAVDLWLDSGAGEIVIQQGEAAEIVAPLAISGAGWQRVQFPVIETRGSVSLQFRASEACEIGVSHSSPLPEFGEKPLAMRLWKGLRGVRLPEVAICAKAQSFVLPADFPEAEILESGSAKYLETENILMIHTDYYGAAALVLRGVDLGARSLAHIQNCGPETVEILLVQVAAGGRAAAKYCPSFYLAPEAYMRADIFSDEGDAADLIIKIKGKSSLDCLALRGFEIG